MRYVYYLIIVCMFFSRVSSASTLGDIRASAPVGAGWLLGGTQGLVLVSKNLVPTSHLTAKEGLLGNRIHTIVPVAEKRRQFFVGGEHGLVHVNVIGDTVAVKRAWKTKAPVRGVHQAGDAVYIATYGRGLYQLTLSTGKISPISYGSEVPVGVERTRVTSITEHNGTLYIGTAGAGVLQLVESQLQKSELSLPYGMVFALASHRRKLYIGTLGGMVVFDGKLMKRLSASDVRAISFHKNKLIIGTFGEGLLQRNNTALSPFENAQSHVRTISISKGQIGVGGIDGFQTFDGAGQSLKENAGGICGDISALAVDGDRLWVGSFDCGLGFYKNGMWHPVTDDRFERINDLALTGHGKHRTLWIGTPKGLFAKNLVKNKVRSYFGTTSLPHSDVHVVEPISRGRIAVGTARGLAIVNRNKTVDVLGHKHHLPKRAVWAIAEDTNGHLWIGTTKGLYRYDYSNRRPLRLSVASGDLLDDWITAIHVDGSDLYVGTYAKGVTKVSFSEDETRESLHLKGGYINPRGLFRQGDLLLAATMSGVLQLEITKPDKRWTSLKCQAPGKDTTAFARLDTTLFVGSRRGLGRISIESLVPLQNALNNESPNSVDTKALQSAVDH